MFGPIAAPVRTQRLLLEPLAVHHADELAPVLDDVRLHVYIGGAPLSLDELRARYAALAAGPAPFHQEGWLNWAIRRRRDGQAVGTVQATVTPGPDGPSAALAWVVAMPYQGFGFATEAATAAASWLRARGVTGLTARIHPGNAASAAVAARIGLRATTDTSGGETVWRDR
ncbi:GNAT family N-acetyltransferase [Actinomadura parmotrematis]|uniref:GNAT family N-acetyltransferase n=1 Tax=Actinomadura parmotrematis TaxID=2864039 RepID=A0ABS7FPT3_9ACTN|nr:GNAT family N-acetyltransferase [Actinomadura parmotrematis]MBW8482398.1 GNAT family N-acetyltransferase [Actinomadura parmotrematis]